MLVDNVHYSDDAPWPIAADGHGRSLHRTARNAFGNFATNWLAMPPTPGTALFAGELPTGDLDLDGLVDSDDTQAFILALMDQEAYEARYGVPASLTGDADGDGDLDYDDIDEFVALLGVGSAGANSASESRGAKPPDAAVRRVSNANAEVSSHRSARRARREAKLAEKQTKAEIARLAAVDQVFAE
jgi:hypothetical protein